MTKLLGFMAAAALIPFANDRGPSPLPIMEKASLTKSGIRVLAADVRSESFECWDCPQCFDDPEHVNENKTGIIGYYSGHSWCVSGTCASGHPFCPQEEDASLPDIDARERFADDIESADGPAVVTLLQHHSDVATNGAARGGCRVVLRVFGSPHDRLRDSPAAHSAVRCIAFLGGLLVQPQSRS